MAFYKKESNIFYIYFQIIKKYKSYMENSLLEFELTPAEIHVLTFLVNNMDRNVTATEISTHRGVSKGLVSRAVNSLKEKEIIEFGENLLDGRSVYLKIVDEKNPLITKVKLTNDKFKEKLTKDISKEELDIFLTINSKLLKNIKDI